MDCLCALESTHLFKKVSYGMLTKLHRLEKCRSLEKSPKIDDEYCVVLFLRHMAETIKGVYEKNDKADAKVKKLNNIISLLADRTKKDLKIHRSLLVSCLKKHTEVFNWLKDNKIKINVNNEIFALWTTQCVPAYVCQFGNNI